MYFKYIKGLKKNKNDLVWIMIYRIIFMEEVVVIIVVGNFGIFVVIERYVGFESFYNELILVNMVKLVIRIVGYRI